MAITKENLINELINDGYLKTPAIIDAFKAMDRKDFLPNEIKDRAYVNSALPIGEGQTISQPLVVAFMLELLDLRQGEKVLEIGTGSGWKTALMAYIVSQTRIGADKNADIREKEISVNPRVDQRKSASIISIERIKELNDFAKNNLAKYKFVEQGIVKLILGDGSLGYKNDAPYDKIVAAASARNIPSAWKEQLKIGGRIVAPVKDSIVVLDKTAKNKFEIKEYFGFSFVPLISEQPPFKLDK